MELPWTDWVIPWAGIGALLMGTGSLLTGLAALKSANKQGSGNEIQTEKADSKSSSSG